MNINKIGQVLMSEDMRSKFEAWAKPDALQKRRTGCGSSYEDIGMSSGWASWQAATQLAEAENKVKVKELEETIHQLNHAIKNADCAAQLMKHLADRYEMKAKNLAEELSQIREQEPA